MHNNKKQILRNKHDENNCLMFEILNKEKVQFILSNGEKASESIVYSIKDTVNKIKNREFDSIIIQ